MLQSLDLREGVNLPLLESSEFFPGWAEMTKDLEKYII